MLSLVLVTAEILVLILPLFALFNPLPLRQAFSALVLLAIVGAFVWYPLFARNMLKLPGLLVLPMILLVGVAFFSRSRHRWQEMLIVLALSTTIFGVVHIDFFVLQLPEELAGVITAIFLVLHVAQE